MPLVDLWKYIINGGLSTRAASPTRGSAGWSVVAAMNRLAFELGPKDSFVLCYAGHGELVESTKLGCWR